MKFCTYCPMKELGVCVTHYHPGMTWPCSVGVTDEIGRRAILAQTELAISRFGGEPAPEVVETPQQVGGSAKVVAKAGGCGCGGGVVKPIEMSDEKMAMMARKRDAIRAKFRG